MNTITNKTATDMTTANAIAIVRTETELETALKNKWPHFIFEGPKASEIVKKLQEAEDAKCTARGIGVGVGILGLLAAPFTFGTSLAALGLAAGSTWLTEAVIIAIIAGIVTLCSEAIKSIADYHMKKLDRDKIEFLRK